MAYRFDIYDNALVVDGWEKGIADDPYEGISNLRNANITSVPGEVSVAFSTAQISAPAVAQGTISAVDTSTSTITYTGASGLESGMAVVFSGSLPTGISTNTVYWLGSVSGGTFKVYSDIGLNTLVSLSSTTTGGTFVIYAMGKPTYFTFDTDRKKYYLVDASGQVWTNKIVTGTNSYWVFTGNIGGSGTANGNGIVYQHAGASGLVMVFRDSAIDYYTVTTDTWTYGWKPSDGTTGNSAGYLNTADAVNNPHHAVQEPDGRTYYVDGAWVNGWYQTTSQALQYAFDPTNTATYTVVGDFNLLPANDVGQHLAYMSQYLWIAGQNNVVYPWDRFSQNYYNQLLLPEYNVKRIVVVNTTMYIFVGNRGRIYQTNGTSVSLFKKIPDHISGIIEPYFTWGDATTYKNQLFFGVSATNNAGTAVNEYGGIWGIDLSNGALYLQNKLSYGTYAGLPTLLFPDLSTATPAGFGIYAGWDNGASGYGLDQSVGTPYTSSQTIIDTDLIPIGTYTRPRNFTNVEYKLSRPLVSGESITIKSRLIFNDSSTGWTTGVSDSTAGHYSGFFQTDFKNAQWVQFQIVLNSTASSPSYVRLRQIRILGLTGPTLAQAPIFNQPTFD